MSIFSDYSFEVIGKRSIRQLVSSSGWILAGVGGPLLITSGILMFHFQLAHHLLFVKSVLIVTACWYVLFAWFYVVNQWMAPHQQANDAELQHLPLPPEQFLIHRMLDIVLVPLISTLLSLPFVGAALYYIGQPLQDWVAVDQGQDQGAWTIRAVLLLVVLFNAMLVILCSGLLTQEVFSWVPGRIVAFLAAPVAIWYLSNLWERFFDAAYMHGPPGIAPLAFIAPLLFAILFPILILYLNNRARKIFLIALSVIIAGPAVFLVFQPSFEVNGEYYSIHRVLGFLELTITYLVSHLNPVVNINLIIDSFTSVVVLDDDTVGNLIPQRIAAWVGACVLVPAAFVACFTGLWVGKTLQRIIPQLKDRTGAAMKK